LEYYYCTCFVLFSSINVVMLQVFHTVVTVNISTTDSEKKSVCKTVVVTKNVVCSNCTQLLELQFNAPIREEGNHNFFCFVHIYERQETAILHSYRINQSY
jgi:hypothetical protein